MGRWKLVEWLEDGGVELYDLEDDPEERNDLSETDADTVGYLLERLHSWRVEVDAKMPREDQSR